MKKVVLAFSGGLDTSYCAKHLSVDLGYEVHAITVNTGGFDSEEALFSLDDILILTTSSFFSAQNRLSHSLTQCCYLEQFLIRKEALSKIYHHGEFLLAKARIQYYKMSPTKVWLY